MSSFGGRRKGFNGWLAMMEERVRKLLGMHRALAAFAARNLRKGMNTWRARYDEKLAALSNARRAARFLVHRNELRGFLAWKPLAGVRQLMRLAGNSFRFRSRRKGLNAWTDVLLRRAVLIARMRGTATAIMHQPMRMAFNTWGHRLVERAEVRCVDACSAWEDLIEPLSRQANSAHVRCTHAEPPGVRCSGVPFTVVQARKRSWRATYAASDRLTQGVVFVSPAQAEMKARSAARTMLGGRVRAAFNALAGRRSVVAAEFILFERALRIWSSGALGAAFSFWRIYRAPADMHMTATLRLPSPTAQRHLRWAKRRALTAKKREVAADDRLQCQRIFMHPHAALLLRQDGALLRPVGVHRSSSSDVCTLDLVHGYDEINDDRAHKLASSTVSTQPTATRVPVHSISQPEYLLMVPGFFGGVLSLSNGLEVRVIDASFSPSAAPLADDEPPDAPRELALRSVLLTMIDERGDSVGAPSWCGLGEVLTLLHDEAVLCIDCAAEEELRRRRRLELHRVEQVRLGLHHLRLATRRGGPSLAWGEPQSKQLHTQLSGSDLHSEASPDDKPHGGVDDLMRQLHEVEAPPRNPDRTRVRAGRQAGYTVRAASGVHGFDHGYNEKRGPAYRTRAL